MSDNKMDKLKAAENYHAIIMRAFHGLFGVTIGMIVCVLLASIGYSRNFVEAYTFCFFMLPLAYMIRVAAKESEKLYGAACYLRGAVETKALTEEKVNEGSDGNAGGQTKIYETIGELAIEAQKPNQQT